MGTDIAKVPPIIWAAVDNEAKRRAIAADERRVTKVRAAEAQPATRPATSEPAPVGVRGRLTIEEDQETGNFVYRIIDERTGEVIRQWPREDMLRMQQAIRAMRGAMFDRRV